MPVRVNARGVGPIFTNEAVASFGLWGSSEWDLRPTSLVTSSRNPTVIRQRVEVDETYWGAAESGGAVVGSDAPRAWNRSGTDIHHFSMEGGGRDAHQPVGAATQNSPQAKVAAINAQRHLRFLEPRSTHGDTRRLIHSRSRSSTCHPAGWAKREMVQRSLSLIAPLAAGFEDRPLPCGQYYILWHRSHVNRFWCRTHGRHRRKNTTPPSAGLCTMAIASNRPILAQHSPVEPFYYF